MRAGRAELNPSATHVSAQGAAHSRPFSSLETAFDHEGRPYWQPLCCTVEQISLKILGNTKTRQAQRLGPRPAVLSTLVAPKTW